MPFDVDFQDNGHITNLTDLKNKSAISKTLLIVVCLSGVTVSGA